jgi:hypothetical protein
VSDEAKDKALRRWMAVGLAMSGALGKRMSIRPQKIRELMDETRQALHPDDDEPTACVIHSYSYGPGPCMSCGTQPKQGSDR